MDNAVNAVNRLISKDPASDQLEGDRGTNNPNKPLSPAPLTAMQTQLSTLKFRPPLSTGISRSNTKPVNKPILIEKDIKTITIPQSSLSKKLRSCPRSTTAPRRLSTATSTTIITLQEKRPLLVELRSRTRVTSSNLNLRGRNRRMRRSMYIIIYMRLCSQSLRKVGKLQKGTRSKCFLLMRF